MKTVAIVQARMRSTRLPGKVLLPLLGRPMLEQILERLARARRIERIVVATSTEAADDPIADCVRRCGGVDLFRGSETDVLGRYHDAALAAEADLVVRVTADCPLIEPGVVDSCIEAMGPDVDYVATLPQRTFPRGLDTEVVRFTAIQRAHAHAIDPLDREHVTRFIWRAPTFFRLVCLTDIEDNSDIRWTVDVPEDYEVVRRIYEAFGRPDFSFREALALFRAHPEWADLNRNVVQKPA